MRHILVIVRALGIKLVLDMDSGDAAIDEFPHRAGRMQRFAKRRPRIGDHRQWNGPCHCRGCFNLLRQGQQRLAHRARRTGDETADIGGIETGLLYHPAAERVVDRRHIQKTITR